MHFRAESRASRSSTLTTLSRPASGLARPTWWAALGVLLLNDHLLKRSGWLSGWITGKLSDFAGLIVAPVLLAALTRSRTNGRRSACFAAVVGCFAAVKLSPDAARGIEVLLGWFGITWRIWSDPTDLIALAVVPLAWRVSRGDGPRTRETVWSSRLGALLGSMACLATSASFEAYDTKAYLVSTTHQTLAIAVYRATQPLDCTTLAAGARVGLDASSFVFERCVSVEPFRAQPLNSGARRVIDDRIEDAGPAAGVDPLCDAVVLRSGGLADTVLFWNGLDSVRVDIEPRIDRELDPHAVYIEAAGSRLYVAGSAHISAWDANFTLPDVACSR